jgi:hypothetical protein
MKGSNVRKKQCYNYIPGWGTFYVFDLYKSPLNEHLQLGVTVAH